MAMTEGTIDVKLLKDIDKAHYFSSAMYEEALKVVANVINGLKDKNKLDSRLTRDELQNNPYCPRLQILHTDLAKIILKAFYKNENVKKVDSNDLIDSSVPIIQSGGHYSLKSDCQNDERCLKDDVIIIYASVKYKDYCSSVIRTLIFCPTKNAKLEENYQLLRNLQFHIFDCLQDGANLGKVYKKAVAFVYKKSPTMTTYLTDNFGTLVGMETEVSDYVIRRNSSGIAKENMVFRVSVGFSGLVDSDLMDIPPHTYALWIGDCVMVHKGKTASFVKYVPSKVRNAIIKQPRQISTHAHITHDFASQMQNCKI